MLTHVKICVSTLSVATFVCVLTAVPWSMTQCVLVNETVINFCQYI